MNLLLMYRVCLFMYWDWLDMRKLMVVVILFVLVRCFVGMCDRIVLRFRVFCLMLCWKILVLM